MRSYFSFATGNRRFIAFGFLAAFSSSFGQTYFVGVFGPAIQSDFRLSHTAWGAIYMAGTLASASLLPFTGRQIDRLDLRRYTLAVFLLLGLACALVAVVPGPATLILAVFLLRQSGQGLMSHVAITSMARYFDAGRGRAIAIATLGFSAGEALLPFAGVIIIGLIGWRSAFAGVVVLIAFILLPAAMWLLKGHGQRHREHLDALARPGHGTKAPRRSWSVPEVLRDARFYLLLPGLLAPPMIMTAMFFHHLTLADAKGWANAWITGNYIVFAAATTLTSLAAGQLIDRLGAVRLVPLMLAPLFVAMMMVAFLDDAWTVIPYLAFAGVNTGLAHTTVAAMWTELYGLMHLGAIKSLAAALGVFGSALGPVTMGGLMDAGMSIENVCLAFAAYTIVGSVLMGTALGSAGARLGSATRRAERAHE
ncbi:MAG TPA: MFS transporter [Gammaproteobacteria bacterium]|nr:MFS transporter [Gammaproteobacteria bacterium]